MKNYTIFNYLCNVKYNIYIILYTINVRYIVLEKLNDHLDNLYLITKKINMVYN